MKSKSVKRTYKRRTSSKYSKVVKKSGRPTQALRKFVLKQVHKNVENKMRMSGGIFSVMPTTHPNYQTQCIFPLTPYYESGLSAGQNLDIAQGTGISNRIGNNITTRSGLLRIVLYPRPYGAVDNKLPCPVNITMWIFKLKSGITDSTGQVLGTLTTNWFKFNNSNNPLTNTLADNVLVVNDSQITVLKRKVYKLGVADYNGTVSSPTNYYYTNNDYKYNHVIKLNVSKYLRQKVKYQDNNLMPTTGTTWLCFTVARADGATFTDNLQVPASFQIEYDYRFEDA